MTNEPTETLTALGITVESVFVPFSQSRSKDQDTPNLNWRVTVKRHGRDVITTDYSAGLAHAPGCKAKATPAHFSPRGHHVTTRDGNREYRSATPAGALAQFRNALARAECESGVKMRLERWGTIPGFEPDKARSPDGGYRRVPVEPNPVDVLYSLVMDSDVLDTGGFEDWAENCGYDTDSRHAESIYRDCLEIALKMRAAFGSDGMEQLQNAFADY